MSATNTELFLVQRFHELVQNYDMRPAVARRQSLPSLSRFLSSPERQIRKLALEAIHLLAVHHDNLEVMGNSKDIIDGLLEIHNQSHYDDPELFDVANKVLDLLAPTFQDGDPRGKGTAHSAQQEVEVVFTSTVHHNALTPSNTGSSSKSRKLSKAVGDYDTMVGDCHVDVTADLDQSSNISGETGFDMTSCSSYPMRRVADPGSRPSALVHSVSKDCPLSVLLEVPALDVMVDTSHIDEILQTTRGVISYTLTPSAHQIRVFLSAFAQAPLQNALTEAGYENILTSAERMHYQGSEAGNQSLNGSFFFDDNKARPSYVNRAKNFASKLFNSVMVYRDPNQNSLAARIRQKRAVEEEGGSTSTADRIAQGFSRWW